MIHSLLYMGFPEACMMLKAFSNAYFRKLVDLGCGDGLLGQIFREHTDRSIGVDNDSYKLDLANERSVYDELILSNIQDYQIPLDADAIFMIESLEHIPKEAGFQILSRISSIPTVVITTPEKFCPYNGHVSLWTTQEFESYGLSTYLVNRPFRIEEAWLGKGIIAIKTPLEINSLKEIIAQINVQSNINTVLTVGLLIGAGSVIYYLTKRS